MIVVDACVALTWVMEATDAQHRYSAAVAQQGVTGASILAAPRIFTTECAAVLLRKGKDAKWGAVLTAEYAEVFSLIPMRLYSTNASIAPQVRFALQRGVDGYDALYLGLAMALGAQLATFDKDLKTAARRAGVELFEGVLS